MRKLLLSFGILLAIFTYVRAEVILTGDKAKAIIDNAELIRYKDGMTNPTFIRFKRGEEPAVGDLGKVLDRSFSKEHNFQFKVLRSEEDGLGFTHIRIQQYVQNTAVEMAVLIAHIKGGLIHSINGYSLNEVQAGTFVLNEGQCLNSALARINAQEYMWDLPGNENASYYPKGEKVMLPQSFDFTSSQLSPCYKFNIYASKPLYRADVYVSAINGEILFEDMTMKHVDSTGTAMTSFSGQRNIVTTYDTSGTFTLRETGRGNGIITKDMLNGVSANNAIDFTNTSNSWPDTLRYSYATDAHWGAEMVYDYYLTHHNRNSIDNNGFALVSYVHYSQGYNNAFWSGTAMHYGDGSGSSKPYTTLDICGHEISHGLTSNTAMLIYQGESGALNESFSDIFGCAIEIAYKPNATKNWRMGEDRGGYIRNMANPKQLNDPDTYEGGFWYTGTADNGGVHTNSGVQNYWFYLLTQGGSGTNDKSQTYSVTGIGVTKSEKIAFRNLTVYLSPSSDYADARFYAIESALDLFGACSQEIESTVNAWYACGVGPAYQTGVSANFSATRTNICAIPAQVDFINQSNRYNIQNYSWDFGDGKTSNQENPSHIYTSPGNYTVKLTASSTSCGSDVESKTSYIVVNPPAAAQSSDVVSCVNYPAKLTANASGLIYWYADTQAVSPIAIGNTFITPVLNKDTVFYAQNRIQSPTKKVGPDTIIGFGQYFNNYQYQIFDVYDYLTLESVVVFAGSTMPRTIQLRNSSGQVLQSKTVTIAKGTQRVQLDFDIAPGYDYQLGVAQGALIDLFRFSSGTNYPYTLNGLLSITKSSAGTNPTGYFYFFFGWKVRAQDCASVLTPVNVSMDNSPSCEPFWSGISEKEEGSGMKLYPNPAGDRFKLEFNADGQGPVRYQVIDMRGSVVQAKSFAFLPAGKQILEVNASSLESGIYVVRLQTGAGIETKQVNILH